MRPLWNSNILDPIVYHGKIDGNLEFFKEDQLKIVRSRIVELRDFIKLKGEKLLTNPRIDRTSSNLIIPDIANFSLNSISNATTRNMQSLEEKKPNPSRLNPKIANFEDILFEDQV